MNTAAQSLDQPKVATLAPAPSGNGREILAVTEDDFFLLDVRKVVTLPNRVWHATSDAQAADMLLSTPCAVAIIDTNLLQAQTSSVIGRLAQQFPDLAFVVTGDADELANMQSTLERCGVQNVVEKSQASKQLARALGLGIDRHLELKSATVEKADDSATKKRLPLIAGGALAGVAAIAAAAWFMFNSKPESVAPSPSPATAASSAVEAPAAGLRGSETIESILQQARTAFEAGRYFDTKGGAALDHYRRVLALDPANVEARDGLNRIAEIMMARAEAALMENKPREASAAIKSARAVDPSHPRIAFLERQIDRELERSAAQDAENAKAEQARQQLAELIKREKERMTQDRLAEQKRADAEREKALAKPTSVAAAAAAQQPQPVETAEQRRARRQTELLSSPTPAVQAMFAKQAALDYPQQAQRDNIEGYVELNFTVSPNGQVSDAVVVGAAPQRTFDDAALRSIKRWKFKPYQEDGVGYARRMSLRLRFVIAR